ncbi:hemerythrin domain-containing protein [Streptomyces sp. NPDC088354]|uniref:hemerythrin domain-containing protein n=1 Tax=unclassified Streptomyces TaxID=2593676 RepID=UPI0029A9028D|nr:hemerythrin domain-containing protein [Streptomyces sp. MI02-7b]MDX3074143.1 hemerythrin domain-containing protein [Streptomyces sp. MI02-7b]
MPRIADPEHTVLSELKWVHEHLRRDLRACRELAADVSAGAPAAEVQARVHDLRTRGPLFQLKVNCLQACTFVHRHHALESASLFPAVRSRAPGMNPVVDKLEADHRSVSGLADAVEAAAHALTHGGETAEERTRLADALDRLSEFLLAHLAYEETSLAPLLSQWQGIPYP